MRGIVAGLLSRTRFAERRGRDAIVNAVFVFVFGRLVYSFEHIVVDPGVRSAIPER